MKQVQIETELLIAIALLRLWYCEKVKIWGLPQESINRWRGCAREHNGRLPGGYQEDDILISLSKQGYSRNICTVLYKLAIENLSQIVHGGLHTCAIVLW